jgi:hypothetical protein
MREGEKQLFAWSCKEVKTWLWLLALSVMCSKNRSTFTGVGDVGKCVVKRVLIQIGGTITNVRGVC